jgi:ribonuclease HI
MKGHVVADFIVDHMQETTEGDNNLVSVWLWDLFFDGSVCSRGQGIGCVLVSPNDKEFELSIRQDFTCTNNQDEYEALLYGLEYLREMGITSVNAFCDSMLVVHQIKGSSQCLDGVLNSYRNKCWEVIKTLDEFHISHIPREGNRKANLLAQQASGYNVSTGIFVIKHEPGVQEIQDSNDQSAKMHGKAGCDIKKHTTETWGNSQQEEEAADGHVAKGTTREVRNKTDQGKDRSVEL